MHMPYQVSSYLFSYRLVFYRSNKLNFPGIIVTAAAEDIYFDTANDLSIDVFEVCKVDKLAVDHQIEIAAIFTKFESNVLKGLTKTYAKKQADIVDRHLVP